MEENKNIIDKIKKLLTLSNNEAATEAEAQAAALKAQKLLAKYNMSIEMINFSDEKEVIRDDIAYNEYKGYNWARRLAVIIARNYCCKCFLNWNNNIVFMGFKEHTEVAKEIFKFLFNIGHNNALAICREYTKRDGHSRGVYNSYAIGFLAGIKSVLDEQCVALSIVVPTKVEESYKALNLTSSSSASLTISKKDAEISAKGYTAGRQALSRRSIEA